MSFGDARIGSRRYLFFLANPHLGPANDVTEFMDQQLRVFGEQLRRDAKVVHSYPAASFEAYREVLSKPWPDDATAVRERMRNTDAPFLLAIDTDFATFDPTCDSWAVLWLPEAGTPESSAKELQNLLTAIARAVASGRDIFSYMYDFQNEREPRASEGLWTRARARLTPTNVGVALQATTLAEKVAVDLLS